ncbi:MAG: Npt1/Npt2 family nucleotide transporter [Saprospiraceae bacterium]
MEILKTYLYKLLGVQKGEVRKVLLMQVGIFLIICASLIVKPIANGLFLTRFGASNLPIAFILVAIVAGVVSALYTRALKRYSVIRIFRLTFIVFIAFLLLFAVALVLKVFEGPVLYMLYIWISIFALVSASQFWIIANFIFNVREAKRLFGLLGAGAISGAIFGGYLTSILTNFVSSKYLLFLCAAILMVCIPIMEMVWKNHVLTIRSATEKKERTKFVSDHPFLLIRKSKHLLYLTAIVFTSVLVAKLIDFQFANIAVKQIVDPDKLTSFFGFWFSTFNVISLLLQIFLTRKVFDWFGVGSSLFFLPAFILIGATFLLLFPEVMFAVIFLKMVDGSLKQSVNKASMELLYLPIPIQIKNHTKIFIDVFVDSIATGFTGLLLIFVIRGLAMPSWVVTIMIIMFGLVWIRLAFKVRQEYVKIFSSRIEEAIGLSVKKSKDYIDLSVLSIQGMRKILKNGSKQHVLAVIRKLREEKEERLYPDVISLLHHPDDDVTVEVLRYMHVFPRSRADISEHVDRLMVNRGQQVKIEIFEFLLNMNVGNREEITKKYLNDEDYEIRTATLVSLIKASKTNKELSDEFQLPELISEWFKELENIPDPVERKIRLQGSLLAMGYAKLPEFFPVISKHLAHPDHDVSQSAFIAAGKTANRLFVPELISFLSEREKRKVAIDALTLYGRGIIHSLREQMGNAELPSDIAKHFAAVAEGIPSRESVEFCFELLSHEDPEVRHEAINALNTLKRSYPNFKNIRINTLNEIQREVRIYHDTLSILYAQLLASERETEDHEDMTPMHTAREKLIDLIEKKMDADLENIFHLLGLHYAFQEMPAVYKVLRSDVRETRADALEFLENLLDPRLKKELMPIVEAVTWESITDDAIQKLDIHIPGDNACFKMILQGHHSKLKMAVIQLLHQIHDEKYLPLIEMAIGDSEPAVRDYAIKVKAALKLEKSKMAS